MISRLDVQLAGARDARDARDARAQPYYFVVRPLAGAEDRDAARPKLKVSLTDGSDEFWEGVLEEKHEQEGVRDPSEDEDFLQRNLDRFDPSAKIRLKYKLAKSQNAEQTTLDVSKVVREDVSVRRVRIPLVRVTGAERIAETRKSFLDSVADEHASKRALAAEAANETKRLRGLYEQTQNELETLADIVERQEADLLQSFAQVLRYKKEMLRNMRPSGAEDLADGDDSAEEDYMSGDEYNENTRSHGEHSDDDDDDDDEAEEEEEAYQTALSTAMFDATTTQTSPTQRGSHTSPMRRKLKERVLGKDANANGDACSTQSPSKRAARRSSPRASVKRRVPTPVNMRTLTASPAEGTQATQGDQAQYVVPDEMPACFEKTTSTKDPTQVRYVVYAPEKSTRKREPIGKIRDWRRTRSVALVWRECNKSNPGAFLLEDADPYVQYAVRSAEHRPLQTQADRRDVQASAPDSQVSVPAPQTLAPTSSEGSADGRPSRKRSRALTSGSEAADVPVAEDSTSLPTTQTKNAPAKTISAAAPAPEKAPAKRNSAHTSLLLLATSDDEDDAEDQADSFGWQI